MCFFILFRLILSPYRLYSYICKPKPETMKNKLHIAILMVILAMAALSCKKDPAVNIESFEITRENLNVGANVATITGTYSYAGVIDGIETCVSEVETGLNVGAFPATLDGNSFSVEITGLNVGTTYSYYYSVDYGVSRPYATESKTFATITESPTVQTLEVLALDSTTFRVKCEVLSDGGQEVTERGICYNTYGDPTMDDATLQHASGGLGQYTIRMENLALGKKYYVRAYAKNAVGVGLGEEMEFETPAPPGMPVSIVLSCDPEEGGSVSGGGTYPVGSQCTVTAVANAGYTFVNWTENGSQVSTDAIYTFDVTRECHLVANFTTQAYVITAEVTPENSGTVTGAGGYNHGEECTLTATAKTGYEFVKWTKNGTTVSTNATFTFTVTTAATYVAHFQAKSYTVTVSAQPSNGGSVTGGGTFNYGQSCTVRATAVEGFTFVNWTDDGDEVSTDVNYTFTVSGNRVLVANFDKNNQDCTIIVSATPSSGGTVSGGGTYQIGQSCTVQAQANSGYIFVNWTENGNEISTHSDFTFVVDGSRVLVANFSNGGNYSIIANDDTWPLACLSSPIVIDVLGNDIIYPNGLGITLSVLTPPAHGEATRLADNTIEYVFNDHTFSGTEDQFMYRVSYNSQGIYDDACVYITVGKYPVVGDITTPAPIIAGGVLGIPIPSVNPIANGHWEYSASPTGSFQMFDPNYIPLSMNGTWVRYSATNDCGEGHSNAVQITVVTGSCPQGAINGLFTINDNGDQVYFSQGNLQYQASTNAWRFATSQYDCIGSANSNISSSYSGWIDLFGWGTSGYNHGAVCYQPWSTSQNNSDYYAYGRFGASLYEQSGKADWGYNAINNGGNLENMWRTLTGGSNGEWDYIFNTRVASTVNGVENARYAKAKVADVQGVILFPDNYSHPSGIAQPVGINEVGNAGYNGNNYNASDFASMQASGAVFMPAAGYRNGSSVFGVGLGYGYYWSATSKSGSGASCVYFWDGDFNTDNACHRSYGNHVRLVQDYNR